jgi:hypothetical protein
MKRRSVILPNPDNSEKALIPRNASFKDFIKISSGIAIGSGGAESFYQYRFLHENDAPIFTGASFSGSG